MKSTQSYDAYRNFLPYIKVIEKQEFERVRLIPAAFSAIYFFIAEKYVRQNDFKIIKS